MVRSNCRGCKGGSICSHNTRRTKCKICRLECMHGLKSFKCNYCRGLHKESEDSTTAAPIQVESPDSTPSRPAKRQMTSAPVSLAPAPAPIFFTSAMFNEVPKATVFPHDSLALNYLSKVDTFHSLQDRMRRRLTSVFQNAF